MVKKEFIASDEEVKTYKEYAGKYKDFQELHQRWYQERLAQEEAKNEEKEAIKSLVLTLRQASIEPGIVSTAFLAETADTIEMLAARVDELENET